MKENSVQSPTRMVVQVGPDLSAQGGISAVIGGYYVYRSEFERLGYSMFFVSSGGGNRCAIGKFFFGWLRLIWLSLCYHVDLVQIHTSIKGSLVRKSMFAVTCMVLRKPYLMHVHSGAFVHHYQAFPRVVRIFFKWVFNRASYVICLSEHARQQFILANLSTAAKCRVVCNGIEDPLPAETKVSLSTLRENCVSSNPITISFLGKLSEAKGLGTLLKMLSELPSATREYMLLVGGHGDVPAFFELVKKYRLSNRVTYLGWISGEHKVKFLMNSAIFVLPSRSEGFPVALVEAMAFGIAVLSTRIPGVVDAVRDGVDGLLVEPNDAVSLRAALIRLLDDADLRERLGESARQRFLDHFTIQHIGHSLVSIYDSVR